MALYNPAQTLTAIEKKKNLTSRARVRVTCAREKLRYEIGNFPPLINRLPYPRHADFPHPKEIAKTATTPEDLYIRRLYQSHLLPYI